MEEMPSASKRDHHPALWGALCDNETRDSEPKRDLAILSPSAEKGGHANQAQRAVCVILSAGSSCWSLAEHSGVPFLQIICSCA